MLDAKAVPPVAAAYHFKLVPVADKLAIVGLPQNVCDVEAVGNGVVTTVAATLLVVTQPVGEV